MPSRAEKRHQRRQHERQLKERLARADERECKRVESTGIPLNDTAPEESASLLEEKIVRFGEATTFTTSEFRMFFENEDFQKITRQLARQMASARDSYLEGTLRAASSEHAGDAINALAYMLSTPVRDKDQHRAREFRRKLGDRRHGRETREWAQLFASYDYSDAVVPPSRRELYEHVCRKIQYGDDREERHHVPPMDRLIELAQRYDPVEVLRVMAETLEEQGDLENLCDILEPAMEMRRREQVYGAEPRYAGRRPRGYARDEF